MFKFLTRGRKSRGQDVQSREEFLNKNLREYAETLEMLEKEHDRVGMLISIPAIDISQSLKLIETKVCNVKSKISDIESEISTIS